MKNVVIESPYAGSTPREIKRNVRYARAAMRDCLNRGEAPFASHLLYTQHRVLRDGDPEQRALGMSAGFSWGAHADYVVVYVDLGFSDGMKRGISIYTELGLEVYTRSLPAWKDAALDSSTT